MNKRMPEGNSFLLELEFGVLRELYRNLDVASKWRDLVAAADGTQFQLQSDDVEECARALLSGGSPTERLVQKWGNSMRLTKFIEFLDELHLERCMLTLRGPEKLVIRLQPERHVQIEEGDSLRLKCEAVGFPYPVYCWFFGEDKELTKSDCGTLEVSNVSVQKAGRYVCRVHHINHHSKVAEHLFSDYCEVHVRPSKRLAEEMGRRVAASSIQQNPQITQQPADVSSEVGGFAMFRVQADCNSVISYQWYYHSEDDRHCSPIEGETEPELRVKVLGKYNAGQYQCRIRSALGQEVLTRLARLSVTGNRKTYTAADKVALLIGISKYQNHKVQLPAVEHDLQASVKMFEKMDFKVISLLNLTLAEMQGAIEWFCDLLSEDVYAVFYCAGHGFLGNNGQHYLIPSDASSFSKPSESLCVETVEDLIQKRRPKLLMFFLDICRQSNSSPVKMLRVERSAKAVPNKIIIYAASEGQQAYEQNEKQESVPRGLFNKCLLEVIDKPLSATDLYKEIIDKFKVLPYSREKYPQHPEMVTNNSDYDRKLIDPIDMDLYRERIADQTSRWCLAHVLPQVPPVGLNVDPEVSVHFSFERVLSNVMEMKVTVVLDNCSKNKINLVDVEVSVYSDVKRVVVPTSGNTGNVTASFTFSDLQRVQTSLAIRLSLKLISMMPGRNPQVLLKKMIPVDLGKPLVAFNRLRAPSDIRSTPYLSSSFNNLSSGAFPHVLVDEMFDANVPINSAFNILEAGECGDRPDDVSVTSN